jgi:hypothetical protein
MNDAVTQLARAASAAVVASRSAQMIDARIYQLFCK